MEGYLSESEDEITYGPITLEEVKKHLELKPEKIVERRHSDSRYCKFYTPSTTFSEDIATKSNMSSPFCTPNESLHVSETDAFLDKMIKVINNTATEGKTDVIENNDATFSYDHNEQSEGFEENKTEAMQNDLSSIQIVCTNSDNICPTWEKADSFIYISSESEAEGSIILIPDESFAEVAIKTEHIKEEGLSDSVLSDSQEADYELSVYEEDMDSLTYTTDSLRLNDTLEEMEMALKQGLDYKMPENIISTAPSFVYSETENIKPQKSFIPTPSKYSQKENIPSEASIFKVPSKVTKIKKFVTPNKVTQFKDIISPVKTYISNSNSNSPKAKKFLTPNKPTFVMTPAQFKDIKSPVGIYIKNSPLPVLKTNVPGTSLPFLHISPSDKKIATTDSGLPNLVYRKKPANNLHHAANLPPSIQKMVPNAEVDVRQRVEKPSEKTGIGKKLLLDENLTLSESTVLEDLAEASIVITKPTFIE